MPVASGWRVSAMVRVCPATVYVIVAFPASRKFTCALPATVAFTSDGLKLPPKKLEATTS